MKYMMMMHAPRGTGGWGINNWSPEDFQAHIAFMHQYNRELTATGEFLLAEGLAMPEEAKVIRASADGTPITDGPFAEAKEFLAGFWIIQVDSAERAYALAAKVSAAPGRGGAPLNMPIEVRQVMNAPARSA